MTKDTRLLKRLCKCLHSLFFLERGLKDVLHERGNNEMLTVFIKNCQKCPNGVPDWGSKDSELLERWLDIVYIVTWSLCWLAPH